MQRHRRAPLDLDLLGRFAHVSGDIDIAPSLQYMGLDVMVWPVIFKFSGTIRY